MFNHYLSKPCTYPIPAALLYALQHVTGSLAPCRSLAEAAGGNVVTVAEKNELMLDKMASAYLEIQRIRREMRNNTAKGK